MTGHGILKGLWALWTVSYPVISCSPLLTSGGTAAGDWQAIIIGAFLFFPWIVGIIILGILVMLSKGERSPAAPKPGTGPTNSNVDTAEPDIDTRSKYSKP